MMLQIVRCLCFCVFFMEQYYFGSGLDYFDSALEENSFNLQLQNTSKQNSTLVNNYETTQLAVFCSPTWNDHLVGNSTRAKIAQRLSLSIIGSHSANGME